MRALLMLTMILITSMNFSQDHCAKMPVEKGTIGSLYGYRIHPNSRAKKFHAGLDIRAKHGNNVYAAFDGKVVEAKKKLDESVAGLDMPDFSSMFDMSMMFAPIRDKINELAADASFPMSSVYPHLLKLFPESPIPLKKAAAGGIVLAPVALPIAGAAALLGGGINSTKTNSKEQKLRAVVWNNCLKERGYSVLSTADGLN